MKRLNDSLNALRSERARLVKVQQKEYQTRGNTQRCQELWTQIEALDNKINEITKKGGI